MTANELRELADSLSDPESRAGMEAAKDAADYLRACADALEAGPVAWLYHLEGRAEPTRVSTMTPEQAAEYNDIASATPLYPVALPAQKEINMTVTKEVADRIEGAALLTAVRYWPQPVNELTEYVFNRHTLIDFAARVAVNDIPQGWKLVPAEPTRDMVEDGANTISDLTDENRRLREALQELLAVAPSKAPGADVLVGATERHKAAIAAARAALENTNDK